LDAIPQYASRQPGDGMTQAKAVEILTCNAYWAANKSISAQTETEKNYWIGLANGYKSSLDILQKVEEEPSEQ